MKKGIQISNLDPFAVSLSFAFYYLLEIISILDPFSKGNVLFLLVVNLVHRDLVKPAKFINRHFSGFFL
jgi:hypothetical protein